MLNNLSSSLKHASLTNLIVSDGTKGKAFCISVGSVKLEKPDKKIKLDCEIAPNKRLFV